MKELVHPLTMYFCNSDQQTRDFKVLHVMQSGTVYPTIYSTFKRQLKTFLFHIAYP